MRKIKDKIVFGKWEATALIFHSLSTKFIFDYTNYFLIFSKTGVVLQSILICAFAFLIFFAMSKLYKRFEGMDILDIVEKSIGSAGKIAVGTILIAYQVVYISLCLRLFVETITSFALPNTPVQLVSLLFVAVACLAAFANLESIVRLHAIFVPVLVVAYVLIFGLSLFGGSMGNLFPLLGSGVATLFTRNFVLISFFADIIQLMMIAPFIKTAKNFNSVGYTSLALTSVVVIFVPMIVALNIPYPANSEILLPVYQLARMLKSISFFQRIESVLIVFGTFSAMLYLSAMTFFVSHTFKKTFSTENNMPTILPFGAIVFELSYIPTNLARLLDIGVWLVYANWIAALAIPLFVLVIANIRGRGSPRGGVAKSGDTDVVPPTAGAKPHLAPSEVARLRPAPSEVARSHPAPLAAAKPHTLPPTAGAKSDANSNRWRKAKSKAVALTLCVVLGVATSGCHDAHEVNDMAYVSAIGIEDGATEQYKYTLQLSTNSSGEGESKSGESGGAVAITAEAPTLFLATQSLSNSIGKNLDMTHTRIIVFSQNVARQGLTKHVQAFVKNNLFRPTTYLAVSLDSPEEYIKAINPSITANSSKYIDLMFDKKHLAMAPPTTLSQFYFNTTSKDKTNVVALAAKEGYDSSKDFPNSQPAPKGRISTITSLAGQSAKVTKSKTEMLGSGVFDQQNKLIGYLNGTESQMYLILNGSQEKNFFSVQNQDAPGMYTTLIVRQSKKPSIKVDTSQIVPHIYVDINLDCTIVSNENTSAGSDEAGKYAQYLNSAFRDSFLALLSKSAKEYASDFLLFGDTARRNFSDYQAWQHYKWLEKYSSASFDVSIKSRLIGPGLVIDQRKYAD